MKAKSKDLKLLYRILEDLEIGMIMWRDDIIIHGKRLKRYQKFEKYIKKLENDTI